MYVCVHGGVSWGNYEYTTSMLSGVSLISACCRVFHLFRDVVGCFAYSTDLASET